MDAASLLRRVSQLGAAQRAELASRLASLSKTADSRERASDHAVRILAFVVPDGNQPLLEDDLRSFLRDRLPEYMLPNGIALIRELPRTANGKVDRRGLAQLHLPDSSRAVAETAGCVAPRNEIEETLVAIWQEVLDLDELSVHDNFFEIGGDSLMSIRILSRMNKAGLRISAEQFFDNPTVASIAPIAQASADSAESFSQEQNPESQPGDSLRSSVSELDRSEMDDLAAALREIDEADESS